VQEQIYRPLRALPKKPIEKRRANSEDVLTPFQFFAAAVLPHFKVQTLLISCQFSYSRLPTKHGDLSFSTSMINPFSPPCCLVASALQPPTSMLGGESEIPTLVQYKELQNVQGNPLLSASSFYLSRGPVILLSNLLGKV